MKSLVLCLAIVLSPLLALSQTYDLIIQGGRAEQVIRAEEKNREDQWIPDGGHPIHNRLHYEIMIAHSSWTIKEIWFHFNRVDGRRFFLAPQARAHRQA